MSPLPLDDIIEWDIPNWSVALDYWRKHTVQEPSSISALEIGSRNGGLSLWAALNGMKVLCTDTKEASDEAIAKHRNYNVSDRIRYKALSALDIPYCEEFDVVLFKSVLGGVTVSTNKSNQAKAVNEIYKSLKKGGELWFAENLVASSFHQFLRKRYAKWGKTWRYVTIQEMNGFLSRFAEVKYTTTGFLGTLGRTPLQRRFLGRMDRIIVNKLVPESWHYIIIGIARK